MAAHGLSDLSRSLFPFALAADGRVPRAERV
jgi:hypothetical protein